MRETIRARDCRFLISSSYKRKYNLNERLANATQPVIIMLVSLTEMKFYETLLSKILYGVWKIEENVRNLTTAGLIP